MSQIEKFAVEITVPSREECLCGGVMRSLSRIFGASLMSVGLILGYQNCGNVSVMQSPIDNSSQSCVDASADLTIVDTQNVGDLLSGNIPAGNRSFQVFQNIDGRGLVPFTPQSASTSWPPLWTRNGVSSDTREIYTQNMSDQECRIEQIEARFNSCGSSSPVVLSKNFIVGRCQEIRCQLQHTSGLIEARENEEIVLFRSASATCAQGCQEVRARCESNGQFRVTTAGAENLNLAQLPRECSPATGCGPELADPTKCEFPEDPLLLVPKFIGDRPGGYEPFYRHWGHVFGYDLNPLLQQYAPPYPESPFQPYPWRTPMDGPLQSFSLMPMGTFSLSRNVTTQNNSRGMYISVPFKMGPNQRFRMTFAPAQWLARVGYIGNYLHGRRAGGMRISISPCSGDFRASVPGSSDQWLDQCRIDYVGSELSGFIGHTKEASPGCKLEPNKIYWLNFAHTVEMNLDGTSIRFSPELASCEMGSCETNALVKCDKDGDPRCL